jgi:hypothetical protein
MNTCNDRIIVGCVISVRSVSYQRRVCGSVCISPILVAPKRRSEGSQSRQTVKYGRESRGTRTLCWRGPAASPIVRRQRLGKLVPTATMNRCRRRFLCGPCHIKGKTAIISYQNFMVLTSSIHRNSLPS